MPMATNCKEKLDCPPFYSSEEFQLCKISGITLIPLPVLDTRFRELDPERELVVHCKSGMRSQKAIALLRVVQEIFRTIVFTILWLVLHLALRSWSYGCPSLGHVPQLSDTI
jgi:hypothetical protein